jgi:hypothetical protein
VPRFERRVRHPVRRRADGDQDHYLVLGVDPGESTHGSAARFRELVHRTTRPCRLAGHVRSSRTSSGPTGCSPYPSVGPPYDAGLSRHRHGAPARRRPITRPPPRARGRAAVPRPISLFRDFAVRRPGLEEVASRFRRSFTHPTCRSRSVPSRCASRSSSPRTAPRTAGCSSSPCRSSIPAAPARAPVGIGPFSCARLQRPGDGGAGGAGQALGARTAPGRLGVRLPLRGLGIHGLFLEVSSAWAASGLRRSGRWTGTDRSAGSGRPASPPGMHVLVVGPLITWT